MNSEEMSRIALIALCNTINKGGGVRAVSFGDDSSGLWGHAPVHDPAWFALGEAYLLACDALGETPHVKTTEAPRGAVLVNVEGQVLAMTVKGSVYLRALDERSPVEGRQVAVARKLAVSNLVTVTDEGECGRFMDGVRFWAERTALGNLVATALATCPTCGGTVS